MDKKTIFNYLKIVVGAFIFSLAVNMFAIPNELGEGGVTGITMMLYYLFTWSPALTNLMFNSVLLIIGYKYLDKATIFLTIFAVALTSIFLRLTTGWGFSADETIVAALAAGAMMGCGMGLVVNQNLIRL